ncbi:helix-turn-helix transcriptional regulator [Streptomyces sp. NPDC048584]|uniref:helix-turn-helix transcriptional regulator n=1 Tax=Streptomyces sp. NPDC048584 TaxID=3365573 RepID=UPI0037224EA0
MEAREMGVLGLSAAEEHVYRHLLRNPGAPLDDAHILLRHSADTVRAAVDRLRVLQIVREDDGTVWAAEPQLVVARLAEQRLEELYGEIRVLTHLGPIIDALTRDMPATATPEAVPTVERITDVKEIRTRLDELSFFARAEVLSAEPYDALSVENIEHARPLDMRCLRRGVVIRNLVRPEALEDPPTVAYLTELALAGAQIRVSGELTELMLVYDQHTALVPIDPQDTSKGALCARESGIVTNIIRHFERLWDSADVFSPLTGLAESAGAEPSEAQRRVLTAMCSVGTDEAGARASGMALRTYRRHISALMQLLGAENRAHAALLARERGWI